MKYSVVKYTDRDVGNYKPLFVVICGQSNAAGFGTSGNDMPDNLRGPMKNVWYWRDLATSGGVNFGWDLYNCGVNSDPAARGGLQKWAMEAQFAYRFRQEFPNRPLYILKNALGGTQLASTDIYGQINASPTNDWAPTSSGELFDSTTSGITAALNSLSSLGYNTSIIEKCVIWMLGEGDGSGTDGGIQQQASEDYYMNLSALISESRTRWAGMSNATWYVGRISRTLLVPNPDGVRMGASRVSVDNNNLVKLIDTDFFVLYADGIHFSAIGYQQFGDTIYKAYKGPYGQPVELPSSFTFSVVEGAATDTLVGIVTPLYQVTPTPVYKFIDGETNGLRIVANTGEIKVNDGSQLVFATDSIRNFNIQASNGYATLTIPVTVNVTEAPPVTDLSGTLFRFDPNNSSFYTLNTGRYQTITDTRGTGRIMTAGSSTRRPLQQTFPGTSKMGMQYSNSDGTQDTMWLAANSSFINDTLTNIHMALIVRPSSSGTSGTGTIINIATTSTTYGLYIFYDYTASKFGVADKITSGANQIVREMGTTPSPPDITYNVRLRKSSSVIQLFINGVERTLESYSGLKTTVVGAGLSGGPQLGANVQSAGAQFYGDIGLGRIIAGDLTISEVNFLNNELNSWNS